MKTKIIECGADGGNCPMVSQTKLKLEGLLQTPSLIHTYPCMPNLPLYTEY